MLSPRDGEKGFQGAVRIGQVAKEVPVYGALPAAEAAQSLYRLQQIAQPLGGNPVFDRDPYLSVLRIRSQHDPSEQM